MENTPHFMNETKRMCCFNCGFRINLHYTDELDNCPQCGELDSITESDELIEDFDSEIEKQ